MSLCDTCIDPGVCCKNFFLIDPDAENSKTFWTKGINTVETYLVEKAYPFIAIEHEVFTTDKNKEYAIYRFNCLALTHTGRCSIYKDRPDICKSLEPGGDNPLCVHSINRK